MPTPAHMLVVEEKEFGVSRYGRLGSPLMFDIVNGFFKSMPWWLRLGTSEAFGLRADRAGAVTNKAEINIRTKYTT